MTTEPAVRRRAPDSFDLNDAGLQADPHRALMDLRQVHGPLVWSDRHRGWLVLSHDAVSAGFRHPDLSSDRTPTFRSLSARADGAMDEVADLLSGWMVFRDPPAHDHLRAPVAAAFTPRRVSGPEEAIANATDRLLDGRSGECELRAGLAAPLPPLVIAELLGIPETGRVHLRAWSDGLAGLVFAVGSSSAPGYAARPAQAASEMADYLSGLLDHYRRHPGDNLLSALAGLAGPASGLTDREVVAAAMLLSHRRAARRRRTTISHGGGSLGKAATSTPVTLPPVA